MCVVVVMKKCWLVCGGVLCGKCVGIVECVVECGLCICDGCLCDFWCDYEVVLV